jgi:hypothetical protein
MSEANKAVAGAWKRGTVTHGQHAVLSAFHAWRRGAGGLGGLVAALPALVRDRYPVEPRPPAGG